MSKRAFIEPKLQVMSLNLSENIAGSGEIHVQGDSLYVTFYTMQQGEPGTTCKEYVISWDAYPAWDTSKTAIKNWVDSDCMTIRYVPPTTVDASSATTGVTGAYVPNELLY